MKSNIKGYVSVNIRATREEVWDALTKPEIIKQYFFGTNTQTDWKPGHAIRFTGEWQGKTYEDKGTVLDIEKYKLIKYSYWSSISGIEDKPENYAILTYEITGEDDNITVSVLQENIPDEKMKTHSEENWNKVLQGLKNLLEKNLKPADR